VVDSARDDEQRRAVDLGVEDATIRGAFARAREVTDEPRDLIGLVIDALADDVSRLHTRGCPFIHAAAEYPDSASRVRQAVGHHREWFRGELEALLSAAEVDDPITAAGQLVLLRDAAMVGGYLDGWDRVRPAFVDAATRTAGLAPRG
jgi:hypothetical protein